MHGCFSCLSGAKRMPMGAKRTSMPAARKLRSMLLIRGLQSSRYPLHTGFALPQSRARRISAVRLLVACRDFSEHVAPKPTSIFGGDLRAEPPRMRMADCSSRSTLQEHASFPTPIDGKITARVHSGFGVH